MEIWWEFLVFDDWIGATRIILYWNFLSFDGGEKQLKAENVYLDEEKKINRDLRVFWRREAVAMYNTQDVRKSTSLDVLRMIEYG